MPCRLFAHLPHSPNQLQHHSQLSFCHALKHKGHGQPPYIVTGGRTVAYRPAEVETTIDCCQTQAGRVTIADNGAGGAAKHTAKGSKPSGEAFLGAGATHDCHHTAGDTAAQCCMSSSVLPKTHASWDQVLARCVSVACICTVSAGFLPEHCFESPSLLQLDSQGQCTAEHVLPPTLAVQASLTMC